MVPLFSRRRGTPLHYSLKVIRANKNGCTVMRCNSKINCSKQFFRHVIILAPIVFPLADRPPRLCFDEFCSLTCRWGTQLANASAPYRGQNLQNWEKKVSGSKKLPFPSVPEKGALSQKIPIPLERPLLGHWEMGVFLTKKPSLFPILEILTPAGGGRVRNTQLKNSEHFRDTSEHNKEQESNF